MVVPRARAQEVRELVAKLKAAKRAEATDHKRVHRPWGYYESIDMGERFQVKRIVVIPGGMLSLQKHHHRAEHWVVVRGTAEVTIGEAGRAVHENELVYIPIGTVHRLANQGKIPLELIEVQTGSYLGEDDIVRLDDVYKRDADLSLQRAAHSADDAILRRRVEIGVHRQADDLRGETIAHRHAALAHRIMLVGLLTVQRDRVIDRGRNALRLERGGEVPRAGRRQAGSCIAPRPRLNRQARSAPSPHRQALRHSGGRRDCAPRSRQGKS